MRSSLAFYVFLVLFSIDIYRHSLYFLTSGSLLLKTTPLDTDFWSSKFCSFQERDRRPAIKILN